MKEYHKIDTPFNRDTEGTKKLIEGDFRNPTVEFLKDLIWQWTEKIDGTNIRIHWDGHNIEIGGRTDKANIPPFLLDYLNNKFMNTETEELFEQLFGEKEVFFYGEGYGARIQNGGNYRSDVSFILFDIEIGDNFQPRATVEEMGKTFNIDVVPIVGEGTIDEAIEFVKTKPKSTIGTADMEGVVARPLVELRDRCGKRVIVKIKVCDFC